MDSPIVSDDSSILSVLHLQFVCHSQWTNSPKQLYDLLQIMLCQVTAIMQEHGRAKEYNTVTLIRLNKKERRKVGLEINTAKNKIDGNC